MKVFYPLLKLYHRHFKIIFLGLTLAIITLATSLLLLALSGWFLAATAVAGFAGLYAFNYMLPAAGVRGAAIFRTAARYGERLVNHNVTFHILTSLRMLTFNKILTLSSAQIGQYRKADLLNRFIADIEHLDHFYIRLFVPFISGLLVTAGIFIFLSFYNITYATVISIFLFIILLLCPFIFYQVGKQSGEAMTQQKSIYREQLVNYLQGQLELTLFNAQERFRKQLDSSESNWLNTQGKQNYFSSLSLATISLMVGLLCVFVILLINQQTIYLGSPMSALFIFICLATTDILSPIPNAFIYLGQVINSAQRVNQLLELEPSINFTHSISDKNSDFVVLKLDNITFSYPQRIDTILNNFSLTVEPKQRIAIIGKTGCGKSTLFKLITRAFEPNSGQILINNLNIKEFSEPDLRNMMSVIPQTIDLFDATLRDNLLLANNSASDNELIEVLKLVELSSLLENESGLDTWLGTFGRHLSGGERRRIGIARALLHDAPLILMDEPTESLDKDTEQQILALIERVYADKTVLMITHRLNDKTFFDKIYTL